MESPLTAVAIAAPFTDANWLAAAASIAGALVAAVAAFITIWWPWHTRKEPAWTTSHTWIALEGLSSAALGRVILTSGQQRPEYFVELTNSGDGTARNLSVEGTNCDAVFFKQTQDRPAGFLRSRTWPVLEPAEQVIIALTPRTNTEVPKPHLLLRWQTEPTRVRKSHKKKPFAFERPLPAKRPLLHQERALVADAVIELATRSGHSVPDLVTQELQGLGLHWLLDEEWTLYYE